MANTDPLSALRSLQRHRERLPQMRHAAGSPIYDSAVRALRELGIPLTPYAAIDAGIV